MKYYITLNETLSRFINDLTNKDFDDKGGFYNCDTINQSWKNKNLVKFSGYRRFINFSIC